MINCDMFKTFVLSWHWPISIFREGNKTLLEVKALTKAKAVEYFKKFYPELDEQGDKQYANGWLITGEVFQSH